MDNYGIAPSGYVDLQVNGYADVDFNADQLSAERVAAVCRRLRRRGRGWDSGDRHHG